MEDTAPSGGGYHKPLTAKQKKLMIERWKQSESIRGLTNKHHEEHEVPIAEDELLKDLEKIKPKSESSKSEK